ncbi:MAG: hypothetical protein HYX32_00485 [Actinobacteria bacterium]|nr:hypothetical protein [Actinomycetota bacterium]
MSLRAPKAVAGTEAVLAGTAAATGREARRGVVVRAVPVFAVADRAGGRLEIVIVARRDPPA